MKQKATSELRVQLSMLRQRLSPDAAILLDEWLAFALDGMRQAAGLPSSGG